MNQQSLVQAKIKTVPTYDNNQHGVSHVTKSKLLWNANIFLQSHFIFWS